MRVPPPPQPKRKPKPRKVYKQLPIKWEEAQYARLTKRAEVERRSMTAVVKRAVEIYLDGPAQP